MKKGHSLNWRLDGFGPLLALWGILKTEFVWSALKRVKLILGDIICFPNKLLLESLLLKWRLRKSKLSQQVKTFLIQRSFFRPQRILIRFVRLLSGDPLLSLRQLLLLDKEIRLFSDNGDFCLDADSFRSRQRDSFVLIVPIGRDSDSGLVRLDFLCWGTLTVILCEL